MIHSFPPALSLLRPPENFSGMASSNLQVVSRGSPVRQSLARHLRATRNYARRIMHHYALSAYSAILYFINFSSLLPSDDNER